MAPGAGDWLLHILQADTTSGAQARPSSLDTREEARIVLEPVVEPVVLRCKADEDSGRLPVAGDHDFPFLGFPEMPGEVVLDLGKRNFLHSGLPNRASHDAASDLGDDRQHLNGLSDHVVEDAHFPDAKPKLWPG
jgi:hypothetical protein